MAKSTKKSISLSQEFYDACVREAGLYDLSFSGYVRLAVKEKMQRDRKAIAESEGTASSLRYDPVREQANIAGIE